MHFRGHQATVTALVYDKTITSVLAACCWRRFRIVVSAALGDAVRRLHCSLYTALLQDTAAWNELCACLLAAGGMQVIWTVIVGVS